MQESLRSQSATRHNAIPLPLALNGILTPKEFQEQTQFGLLRGIFQVEPTPSRLSSIEEELYHPFFNN